MQVEYSIISFLSGLLVFQKRQDIHLHLQEQLNINSYSFLGKFGLLKYKFYFIIR